MKEKAKNVARTAFHVGCILVGMAIAGFGFKQLLPKKKEKYSRTYVKVQ